MTRQKLLQSTCCLALLLLSTACVYQVDVQQGNKLEEKNVEAVAVGMTRNQVRFLLGTPVVADPFHDERWDYVYYFRKGRSETPERRWMIIWFEEDRVSDIQRDVPIKSG
jgi:outer membrane protein assembly factor BamE